MAASAIVFDTYSAQVPAHTKHRDISFFLLHVIANYYLLLRIIVSKCFRLVAAAVAVAVTAEEVFLTCTFTSVRCERRTILPLV